MARRNKILLATLLSAVVALLIALCFVGNTFARYTLKQEESVTASIAEWGVSLTQNNGTPNETTHVTTNNVGTLKPLATAYDETGATTRNSKDSTDAVNFVLVATLTNTGKVDATVNVTADVDTNSDGSLKVTPEYKEFAENTTYGVTDSYNKDAGGKYQPASDTGYANDYVTTGSDYADEVASHFVFDVMYSFTEATSADDTNLEHFYAEETEENKNPTLVAGSDTDNTIYIYLDVEWISDIYDSTSQKYVNGDGFDTWAGIWVSGFTFGLTIEAYQAS